VREVLGVKVGEGKGMHAARKKVQAKTAGAANRGRGRERGKRRMNTDRVDI
jgi:hypothetical protein